MARSYRHVQAYRKEIFELKEKGLTHRKIAEKFVFNKGQVDNFVKRQLKE